MTSRNLLRIATAAALFVAGSAGAADVPHWYGGVHLGQNNLDHMPATVNFGAGVTSSGELKLDKGVHFGLFAGRRTENAKFELEFQSGSAGIESARLGSVTIGAGGKARYYAVTANAYRMFPVADKLEAFVGAGIGFGRMRLPQLASIGTCNCFPSASGSGFVYQLRLGAEYEIVQDNHLILQYTLLHLPGSDGGAGPTVSYPSRNISAVGVGYRAAFR